LSQRWEQNKRGGGTKVGKREKKNASVYQSKNKNTKTGDRV